MLEKDCLTSGLQNRSGCAWSKEKPSTRRYGPLVCFGRKVSRFAVKGFNYPCRRYCTIDDIDSGENGFKIESGDNIYPINEAEGASVLRFVDQIVSVPASRER